MGKKQGTIILPCTCVDEQQDKMYGKGMRLHNVGGKLNDQAYCTVCSPSQQRTTKHLPSQEIGEAQARSLNITRIIRAATSEQKSKKGKRI